MKSCQELTKSVAEQIWYSSANDNYYVSLYFKGGVTNSTLCSSQARPSFTSSLIELSRMIFHDLLEESLIVRV